MKSLETNRKQKIYVKEDGFLIHKTKSGKPTNGKTTWREWWFVRQQTFIGFYIPARFEGKRIRIKVEEI